MTKFAVSLDKKTMRRMKSLLHSIYHFHSSIISNSIAAGLHRTMATAVQPISPSNTRLGWIGTGVMGQSMCSHLIKAGYTLTIFTRTQSKAQPLLDIGANWASSPHAVASQSDVVFSIVGYPSDVRHVLLHPTSGALAGLSPNGILVDMTTSEPSLAIEISNSAAEKSCFSIDAPVSGGDRGARNAALSIFAGGDESTVKRLNPIFTLLGKVNYMGGPGKGQFAKLANQITIASTMVGLIEGMIYAHKAGLDLPLYLDVFESLDSLRNNSSINNEEITTSFNCKSKDDHPMDRLVNFIVSETTMASKICPVCKTFSSSSNTTLNAHIDRCLSEESKSNISWSVNPNPSKIMVKHRIKPRKTRLMVEIYKTAPQCTVEELDRRNGTNWATNSSFPDQEFECQEEEEKAFNQDHEGAVYIDTNGTKVRILSMPEIVTLEARKLQKGSKIVMEKKKKKVYVQKSLNLTPKSKKLSSLKPHSDVSKENKIEESMKGKVDKQLINNLVITRPPWACSKRTVLVKKLNGKNGMLHSESDKSSDNMSSLHYSKKARTKLTKGIKFASLNPNLLLSTQENNSGSKINLKRKSLHLKKSNENDDPFQDSLKHKSRIEEEEEDMSKNSSFEMENVFEVKKKKSITSKSSDVDSLESIRTEIPFQGSFMGLRNSLDDEFSKFELQESMENIHNIEDDDMDDAIEKQENYFQEVDTIPIPGPPGSFLPPSPGGDIISEQLQPNNSSLTTTISRLQSTEYHHPHHHHQHHDHMINMDFMSESPNSTISSPSFIRSDDKFFPRFTSLQDPNLCYTDVMFDKKSTPMASSSSGFKNDHHCCCSRKEAVFPKNISSYPRESVVSRNESIKIPVYKDCESVVTAPVLRLMGKNLTVVNTNDHIVDQFRPPSCSISMTHHQHQHQHPLIFNHNQNGSSSILHPTSHGSSLGFIPNIRSSSTSYYPPSFS